MELSLGIAIGSGIQVALFVAPVLVLLSYFMGRVRWTWCFRRPR